MKGANRKLFRKPGLASQAIGILASSNELADQVQSVAPNMMPRQPVQKFKMVAWLHCWASHLLAMKWLMKN